MGTGGDDEILINMNVRIIRINGVVSSIPAGTDVTFDGLGETIHYDILLIRRLSKGPLLGLERYE